MLRVALLLVLSAATATVAGAQIGTTQRRGDERVRKLLDELNLKYTLTSRNNFELNWTLADTTRSQTVFVMSNTETYENLEIREVTSTAYASSRPLPAELANRLLTSNERKKLGAWRVLFQDDKYYVIYAIQLAAEVDAATLSAVMQLARNEADKLEKELTGRNEY